MRAAEREARDYLDRAKRRADSLVETMVGAVEREAAEIRREAEDGIRERWNAVEVEAGRFLDDARGVADGIVAERQSVIGSLSDGIVGRARALTDGLEDADRVRSQFESFVKALSETSNRIADEAAGHAGPDLSRVSRVAGTTSGEARSRPRSPMAASAPEPAIAKVLGSRTGRECDGDTSSLQPLRSPRETLH